MTLLRLAFGTAVVLAPGLAIARAFGVRSVSGVLAWALAALFVALGVTFALGTSLTPTLVLLLAAGVAAIPFWRRAPRGEAVPGRWWVFGVGVLLGLLLWQVAGEIGGDGLFHLARARKLDELDALSPGAVNEFADGGLHPGYAFPLWHAFLAVVARVGFLDPADVVLHEATVLVPLALLVTYEAAWALFRRVGPAVAAVLAQIALTALAPNGGGAYTALGLPATASRQLLVPAALALALAAAARPSLGLLLSAAAAGFVLAVVHPTYAIFLWIPFAGFLAVRALVARREVRGIALALAALVVPSAAFLAALVPVIRSTRSVRPEADELQRAFEQYAGQLVVSSETSYRLAADVFARSGSVAVAALVLVPLAGLAARRRWGSFVVGASLAVLAVCLVPLLFVPFSELVSLSQARRAAGFLPFAFAFAGGLTVLTAPLRVAVLPVALAAGIALQALYPGDFGYRIEEGGPALAAWIAAFGGVAALAVGLVFQEHKLLANRLFAGVRGESDPGTQSRLVVVAAALFVLPVAVHAAGSWEPSETRRPTHLTAGLVEALRDRVPEGDVVFSDLESSYRIAAAAPVYIAAAPPSHVADTRRNRPYVRRRENIRFFRDGNLAYLRRYRADWLVVDRRRFTLRPRLEAVYADERFTLYRVPSRL